MEPLKLLKFLKDDIYEKSIAGSYFTSEEANDIIQTLDIYIKKLSAVRHSEELTKKILTEVDQISENKMRSITWWLTKLLEDDKSFVYAFNPLAQGINIRMSQIAYKLMDISKVELCDLLEAEKCSEVNTEEKRENQNISEHTIEKKIVTTCDSLIPQDQSGLFNALSKYISGINVNEFTNIIQHHSLIPGTPKATWIKVKSEARYFANYIDMDIPTFNKCFSFADGTKLMHHDMPTTKKLFKNILAKHLPK